LVRFVLERDGVISGILEIKKLAEIDDSDILLLRFAAAIVTRSVVSLA
jgi:hypothetical protein